MKKYLTNKAFFVAAILVAGIFAISQIPSNAAMADGNNDDQIPSSVTIPLEGLTLTAGQYIELTDTTPVLVTDSHVTINVPCDNGNNNDPESDIAVVAGVAPDLEAVELEFIEELSDPEHNCLYHADVPENEDDEVTDIVILNPGDETVKFRSGNFATISITEVSDD
ncbi:MAG TPA: hypothetical protein VE244_02300 [Nitrososphaeraceae archaeon]|jgi:hypothetical protein|nr:hypothetical protein [Nitrososphaeraceae archaeon]